MINTSIWLAIYIGSNNYNLQDILDNFHDWFDKVSLLELNVMIFYIEVLNITKVFSMFDKKVEVIINLIEVLGYSFIL